MPRAPHPDPAPVDLVDDRVGIDCTVEAELPVRLAGALETVLYRVAQEALTNVAKHARASQARVSLRVVGDRVSLQVGDDGAGFATTRVADHLGQDHFGPARAPPSPPPCRSPAPAGRRSRRAGPGRSHNLQAAATAAEQEQHQQHDDDDQQQCAEPHLASLRVERGPTRPAGRLTNQTGGHG
jgi:hypothetical protein